MSRLVHHALWLFLCVSVFVVLPTVFAQEQLTETYTSTGGVTINYPSGWVVSDMDMDGGNAIVGATSQAAFDTVITSEETCRSLPDNETVFFLEGTAIPDPNNLSAAGIIEALGDTDPPDPPDEYRIGNTTIAVDISDHTDGSPNYLAVREPADAAIFLIACTDTFAPTLLAILASARPASEDNMPASTPNNDDPTSIGLIAFDVYFPEGTGIYTVNADGTNPQRLTEIGVSSTNPVWSPDGTQIAFDSYATGNSQVNIMNADGSNVHAITSGEEHYVESWSPDGSQILYVSATQGEFASPLYSINVDGTNDHQILPSNGGPVSYYKLSPDGSQILFLSYEDFTQLLSVMDADGANVQQLTDLNIDGVQIPVWSPDSSQIIFSDSLMGDIYVIDADGNNLTQLTNNDNFDYAPTFSPDGSQIAFGSQVGATAEIYVMNADGSTVQQLTSGNLDGSPQDLAWQPNSNVTAATVPTLDTTSTPTDTFTTESVGVTTAPQEIAYRDTISGILAINQSVDYSFEGSGGDIIRLELYGDGVCYRFTAPEDYQFSADADGDLYYGLGLPFDGTYTLTLVGVTVPTADYSFTVVHDLAYEYGVQGVLDIGGVAEVYTEDEGLKLRAGPSTDDAILETMPSGTQVELLDGPFPSEGYFWWNVRAPSGNEGWSVESAGDIQTLNPVAVSIIPDDLSPAILCP